jgi:hypothetical protein
MEVSGHATGSARVVGHAEQLRAIAPGLVLVIVNG